MAHRSGERMSQPLRLDKKNGWIAGLCAGIADYFNTDATFIRVGVIVTALFLPKLTIAAYLIGWLLIDHSNQPNQPNQR